MTAACYELIQTRARLPVCQPYQPVCLSLCLPAYLSAYLLPLPTRVRLRVVKTGRSSVGEREDGRASRRLSMYGGARQLLRSVVRRTSPKNGFYENEKTKQLVVECLVWTSNGSNWWRSLETSKEESERAVLNYSEMNRRNGSLSQFRERVRLSTSRTANEVGSPQTMRSTAGTAPHQQPEPVYVARENYLPLHHVLLLRNDSLINTFRCPNVYVAASVAAAVVAGTAEMEVLVVLWRVEQLIWLSSATRNRSTLMDRLAILLHESLLLR